MQNRSEEGKKSFRKNLIRGILSCCLLVYLVLSFLVTNQIYAKEKVNHINIYVQENNGNEPFVTPEGLKTEIPALPGLNQPINEVDFSKLEKEINSIVNVEVAEVNHTMQGNININVIPMMPVARIFTSEGRSYYINKEGKKLTADARYHIDVPIITGYIDDGVLSAVDLLPLLNYIASDPLLNSLTSSLKVTNKHDILLIPSIKGHVVNLGSPTDKNIDDKFSRLMTVYRKVMPVKGWQYYDTISVKFNGQVVATRAQKRTPERDLKYEYIDNEEETLDNMITKEAD